MEHARTPLSRIRGPGSARCKVQRLTAAGSVPLTPFLLASLVALTGANYATVQSHLSNPIVAITLVSLTLSSGSHMYAGVQVIIEDYVHNRFSRAEDWHQPLGNSGAS